MRMAELIELFINMPVNNSNFVTGRYHIGEDVMLLLLEQGKSSCV